MSLSTKCKKLYQQLLWFIALYVVAIVVVGGFIYLAKTLLTMIT